MKDLIAPALVTTSIFLGAGALWWLLERALAVAPLRRLPSQEAASFSAALHPDVDPQSALRIRSLVAQYLTIPENRLTSETLIGKGLSPVFQLSQHSERVEQLEDAVASLASDQPPPFSEKAAYDLSVRELVVTIHQLEKATESQLRSAPGRKKTLAMILIASLGLSLLLVLVARACSRP